MSDLLAHEWLARTGGSENVFQEMAQLLPQADRLSLWNDAPERFGDDVRETWLARTPFRRSKSLALPLMPLTWRAVSLTNYERVIVSSHAFGHHLAAQAASKGMRAYAYVHTPARYIWVPDLDHRGKHWAATASRQVFRAVDRRSTHHNVAYAANSEFVRERIRRAWGQDSVVIYPPVDVDRISNRPHWRAWLGDRDASVMESLPEGFILGASRMVPYKQLDSAIQVGASLDRQVVLVGEGPDEPRLRALAERSGTPVHFVGRVSDELLIALYQAAALFVFLAIEDFGIMPVEAMAAGTPVLVNSVGGARESVEAVGLGAVWESGTSTLTEAAHHAMARGTKVAPDCQPFSSEQFRKRFSTWIADGDLAG